MIGVAQGVQGTQQTQQALGELDVQDDLDDINLDQLVSSWQARRAQQPPPASMRQNRPHQLAPNSSSDWQGPSTKQPPATSHASTHMQDMTTHGPYNSMRTSSHDSAAAAPGVPHGMQNPASANRSMQGLNSHLRTAGGPAEPDACPAPGRCGVDARTQQAASQPGPSQHQPGLEPALQSRCSHGVPLGMCHQGERHLADLKDALLKVWHCNLLWSCSRGVQWDVSRRGLH